MSMAPQTTFELTGALTPLADEAALLQQIAAETGATLTEAGRSAEGRVIHRVTLGTGTANTMLIVSLQHGNEPASREAVLQHIRDLAYSTDPAVLAYLSTHRLVYVPNASPDGFVAETRLTSQGINMNRDYYVAQAPETQAVLRAVRDTGPQIIVDMHEMWLPGGTVLWTGYGNGLPGTHPEIQTLGTTMTQHTLSRLASEGHNGSWYPVTEYPRAGLTAAAGMFHAVGMLGESNVLGYTLAERVSIQRRTMDHFTEWHEANSATVAAARDASKEHALTSTGADTLAIREQFIGLDAPEVVRIAGYRLTEPLDQKYVDLFGITITDGVANIRQDARGILPQLLDPAAMDKQVEASREIMPQALPTSALLGLHVRAGGSTRPVVGIRHRAGGKVHDVTMP
ncbi:MAG: M14 family zinc carboxypeptidase [Micrococcus sp.]|nr:M14 family zinc carboxypeptidase [Micrococcus sp.]